MTLIGEDTGQKYSNHDCNDDENGDGNDAGNGDGNGDGDCVDIDDDDIEAGNIMVTW